MHIIPNIRTRVIAGETIAVLPGKSNTEPTRVISFNSTAVFLWDNLKGKEFSEEDAVNLLLDNYEVSREQAALDVQKWASQLKENGVIAE